MRYDTRYRSRGFFSSGSLPDGVKWLIVANVAIFVLTFLLGLWDVGVWTTVSAWLALSPYYVVHYFRIWQLGTYLFLHGGFWHVTINMLMLWMFGVSIERDWGTRRFLKYYAICGIGAGLCDVTANIAIGNWNSSTIGASGAIYGVLLAFGVLYPDTTVLFAFLFPIKAKYLVMIYGAFELLAALGTHNTGVSNVAHLGGMAFGFAYLKMSFPSFGMDDFRRWHRDWKLQRAKKKFQVYMRKHDDRGPWVN